MHVVHDRQCISKCAKALFRKMLVSIVERNDGHVCCISPLKLLCSQSHWITQPRCTPSSISGQVFLRFLPAWFLPWSNSKQQTSQGLGLVTKGISKAQIFRSWYMPFGSSRAWRLMMPTNTRDALISFFNFRLGCAPSSQDHVSLSLITSQFFAGNSQGSHPRSWRGLLHRSERSNWETRKSPRSMRQNAERNLRTLQAKHKRKIRRYTMLQDYKGIGCDTQEKGETCCKTWSGIQSGGIWTIHTNLANCQEVTLVHRPSPQHRDDVKWRPQGFKMFVFFGTSFLRQQLTLQHGICQDTSNRFGALGVTALHGNPSEHQATKQLNHGDSNSQNLQSA